MGMSQQMPIDITSPTTPSEHGSTVSCSQSQPSHSGKCYSLLVFFYVIFLFILLYKKEIHFYESY